MHGAKKSPLGGVLAGKGVPVTKHDPASRGRHNMNCAASPAGAAEESGDAARGVHPFSKFFECNLLRGQGVVLGGSVPSVLGVLFGTPEGIEFR